MEVYEATIIIILGMTFLYWKLSDEIQSQGQTRTAQLKLIEEGLRDDIWDSVQELKEKTK